MTKHLLLFFLSLSLMFSYESAIIAIFTINLIFFWSGSKTLIKKLLLLETLSIMLIFFVISPLESSYLPLDFLFILMTFLVIDAVLGLSLIVATSRKSSADMKISKYFWLCS